MRIAISGSHGVGKTTLLEKINFKGHRKINEIARDEIRRRGCLPHQMSANDFFDFQLSLVRLQRRQETGDFIIDRTLFDMLAYAMDHHNHHLVRSFIERCFRPYDYVFYVPIEFTLIIDDVRKNDLAYQRLIDKRIKEILNLYQVHYYTVSGNLEQRLAVIRDILRYDSKS